jgi:hypothetical protein
MGLEMSGGKLSQENTRANLEVAVPVAQRVLLKAWGNLR